MLVDGGIKYSIVGHSERRAKGESNADVARKAQYAVNKGVTVIACIGETLAQREAGKTNEVVLAQLKVNHTVRVLLRSPHCSAFCVFV